MEHNSFIITRTANLKGLSFIRMKKKIAIGKMDIQYISQEILLIFVTLLHLYKYIMVLRKRNSYITTNGTQKTVEIICITYFKIVVRLIGSSNISFAFLTLLGDYSYCIGISYKK